VVIEKSGLSEIESAQRRNRWGADAAASLLDFEAVGEQAGPITIAGAERLHHQPGLPRRAKGSILV
jgi:hypothetical protein